MKPIDRISLSTGWQPTDWQRALSQNIPPMAVYGIFREAEYTPQRRLMTFPHQFQLDKARTYERAVSDSLGMVVMVSGECE